MLLYVNTSRPPWEQEQRKDSPASRAGVRITDGRKVPASNYVHESALIPELQGCHSSDTQNQYKVSRLNELGLTSGSVVYKYETMRGDDEGQWGRCKYTLYLIHGMVNCEFCLGNGSQLSANLICKLPTLDHGTYLLACRAFLLLRGAPGATGQQQY